MKKKNKILSETLHFIKTNRLAAVGGSIVIFFLLMGILAPWVAPQNPTIINTSNILQPPNPDNLLGTDHTGRDILSRIIYGARISLTISFAAVLMGSVVGITMGMVAGWFDFMETPIMRLVDVMLCFPSIIIALTIISILGIGIGNLVIAIAINQVPSFARLAYGLTKSVKEGLYVTAALSVGAQDNRIIGRHILPNIAAPLIVQMSLLIPSAIMMTAGLSFLGLGIAPPTAEWGGMLQDSMKYFRTAPHVMIYPGLALMMVVFGFNTFGDGLRIALDPRMRID